MVCFSLDEVAQSSSAADIFLALHATLNFSPFPIQSPAIGALLTLSLDIANGEDVAGYQTTVRFDTSTLRYVESAKGDYLPAGAFFVPPIVSGDTVTLGATSFGGVSSGKVTFEVFDVKASTLSLSDVILTDSEGEHLRVLAKPGQVIEPTVRPSSAVVIPFLNNRFSLTKNWFVVAQFIAPLAFRNLL